ncbi:Protein of unknown function DUF1632 domain containing protein [Aphelenchoides fujianensis]|nr:Protein of unknown function DUF1632 domain containing protein [Aphelenchoides fujianensis]
MLNGTGVDVTHFPTWIGVLAIVITVAGFGTVHVPIRKFPTGDGFFVQWAMSVGTLCVGFLINVFCDYPPFEPFAMVGGMCWAIANTISQRVISGLGLAPGLLIWSSTNCLTGWTIGRFGLFGIRAKPPASDWLNCIGLIAVLFGSLMISLVRKTPRVDQPAYSAYRIQPTIDLEAHDTNALTRKSSSMPDPHPTRD